ncbi:hypothetical protein SGUI_0395 [Serinicoccus hydrothermalis]|uniref:DUF881 domain-containing protein n=1 Tax=Serinicoccus hydrothermalis TaxID=1758689 RepID=A0A1B1N8Q1_9MICO|nr:DUF881 domain-containing protein [Serinicoccus hydrothermalis]ANS77791.1 hypothetical protein SGUI_0395 [Serinicoccus hydrothermalis]
MRLPRGHADPDPDPAASMALLEEVLDPPLGPGYHSAAQARTEQGLPASSGTRTWLMFGTTLVLGVLLTTAATTLRAPDPAEAAGRAQLVERIEEAERVGDERSLQVDALRAEVGELEQQALVADSGGSGEAIAAAAVSAGGVAVAGPGVRLTLHDADEPADDAPGEDAEPERINSRDLQLVVNGLWRAGAEAISVDGHRLTSTSAIRFAGQAIIVDFRGLTPPYDVLAIGPPEELMAELTTGATGAYLAEIDRQLGLTSDVSAAGEVTIGAADRLSTRVSSVVTGEPPTAPSPGGLPTAPSRGEEPR